MAGCSRGASKPVATMMECASHEVTLPARAESPRVEPRPSSSAVAEFTAPAGDVGRIGPFRLLSELGRGGMGIVYRGWDEPLSRVVAIKVLRPEHAEAADRYRLVREAQLAARFQNDHAVMIHSVVDPPDGLPYLVMEYVPGPTLAELIDSTDRPAPGGSRPWWPRSPLHSTPLMPPA